MAPTWILVCQIFIFSSNCTCTFLSLFLLLTCFLFFIFSSPSFVTLYKNSLKYFFSLFFFFFKKKKIKKDRAGNLSPKMFKIRMIWGNKSVRKNSALLFYYLLTTYLLMILDNIEKKTLHTNCSLFFVKEQGSPNHIHSIQQRQWPKHLATEKKIIKSIKLQDDVKILH